MCVHVYKYTRVDWDAIGESELADTFSPQEQMFMDEERVGHVNSDLCVCAAVWVLESGGTAESITIGMWT